MGVITDRLVEMLPHLSRMSGIVDDAARLGQTPHPDLVRNVVQRAHDLNAVAINLVEAGQGSLGRELAKDAVNLARKGGVMHAMQEHRQAFSYSWSGQLRDVVSDVERAVRQLT